MAEVGIVIGVLFAILILLVFIIIVCFKVLADRRVRDAPDVHYVRVSNQEPQVAIVPNPNPSREMRDIRDLPPPYADVMNPPPTYEDVMEDPDRYMVVPRPTTGRVIISSM